MKNIHRHKTVRMLVATLVGVAVVILSTLASHAPAQHQSSLMLTGIRTDSTTVFYADRRENRAWFVEAALPTGNYADHRVNRAWFVEAVLPTGGSDIVTENLKSVAATL